MKTWMLALSLIAVLGFTGLAEAKGKKNNGVKGTIATIVTDANGKVTSFTMNVGHGKKKGAANANAAAPTSITVDASSATITGTLATGAKVSVVGTQTGANITATTITVSKGHKKKKAST